MFDGVFGHEVGPSGAGGGAGGGGDPLPWQVAEIQAVAADADGEFQAVATAPVDRVFLDAEHVGGDDDVFEAAEVDDFRLPREGRAEPVAEGIIGQIG